MKANERRLFSKKTLPLAAACLFIAAMAVIVVSNGVPRPQTEEEVVLFSLDAPEARTVSVVGNFNNWNPRTHALNRSGGVWRISIALKKSATYFYNFVIDGERWITDPARLTVSDDGLGKKSVLELYEEE